MNIHGNDEAADIFGNSTQGVFGEPVNANVIGQPPLDVWGHPTGLESDHDAISDVVGGLVDWLSSLFF